MYIQTRIVMGDRAGNSQAAQYCSFSWELVWKVNGGIFLGYSLFIRFFFFLHNLFCNSFPPPPPLGVLGGHPLGKQTTVKILGKYNFARGFWWAYKWGGGGGRGAMPAVLISAINIISKRADKKYAYCQT